MYHRDLISHFFQCPSMYICRSDFASVTAFLQGYDVARDGSLLAGFREWLVVQLGYGNNFGWTELVLRLLHADLDLADRQRLITEENSELVRSLVEVFGEFCKERDEPLGLKAILSRHAKWLQAQGWS